MSPSPYRPVTHLQMQSADGDAAACGTAMVDLRLTEDHSKVDCLRCRTSPLFSTWEKEMEEIIKPEVVTAETITAARDERYAEAEKAIKVALAFRLRAEEFERDALALRAQGDHYNAMLTSGSLHPPQ